MKTNDRRDTEPDQLAPDERPTGTHHVVPPMPPGADGALPPSVGGDLRAAIEGIQEARRDFSSGMRFVQEAVSRMENSMESLESVVKMVQKHDRKLTEQEKMLNEHREKLAAHSAAIARLESQMAHLAPTGGA